MAFVPLVPVVLNITVNQGLEDNFIFPTVKNAAGTNIDLSAWVSLSMTAIPPAPSPTSSAIVFGTPIGAAAGLLTAKSSPSDFAGQGAGNTRYVLSGKPTSGDALQTLATGIVTLNATA